MKAFLVMFALSFVVALTACLLRVPSAFFPPLINVAYGTNAEYDESKTDYRDASFSLWELYRNNDLAKFFHMMFDMGDFINLHPNNEISKAFLGVTDPERLCEEHPSNEACATYRFLTQQDGLCEGHENNELCKSSVMLLSPSGYCKDHPSNEMCRGRELIKDPKAWCRAHRNNDLCKAGGGMVRAINELGQDLEEFGEAVESGVRNTFMEGESELRETIRDPDGKLKERARQLFR